MEFPTFSSNILFELYKEEDGSHSIRMLYNDKEMFFCGENRAYCPLNSLIKLFDSRFIPKEEYESKCART